MWNRHHASIIFVAAVSAGQAHANVVGNDNQNFNPAMNGSDFVTVQSSTTLSPGQFHLGLFVNHAVNSLPYEKTDKQTRSKVSDTLTSATGFVGFGLLPRVDVSVGAPFVINQQIKNDDTRGEFAENGNTDIMAAVKIAVVKQKSFGLALVAGTTINRTEDNPAIGQTNTPIYNMELAADVTKGRMTYGVNAGYRWRETGERIEGSLVDPMSNQALASAALGYKLNNQSSVVTEIYTSHPMGAAANESNRSESSAEALLGLRHNFNPMLLGHLGAGTELMHGYATPDWRLYAGIVTTFGGNDKAEQVVSKKAKKAKKKRTHAPEKDDGMTKELPSDDDYVQPALASLPQGTPTEVFVLHNINFEFDSDYRVLPGAVTELQKLVKHLEQTSYTNLVVEGHTDYMGSDEYNMDLSFRRARTVRRYLIKFLNMTPSTIDAVGYGESKPMTADTSDAGRQLNRRVEIKIYNNHVLAH